MLLSTTTAPVFRAVGDAAGIDMLARAGFDAMDFTLCDMAEPSHPRNHAPLDLYIRDLRKVASDAGILFRQAHAPMPTQIIGNDGYNQMVLPAIHRAIRIAGGLGATNIVMHPIVHPEGGEVQWQYNLAFFSSLAPTAEESGIKIAIENTFFTDKAADKRLPHGISFGHELAALVDTLGDPFTACLDVGHNAIAGEDPADAIRALGGDRLGALHIHDNDRIRDLHELPFTDGCTLNWDAITAALSAIGYRGDFTLEADSYASRFDEATMPSALQHMVQVGRVLMEKLESKE